MARKSAEVDFHRRRQSPRLLDNELAAIHRRFLLSRCGNGRSLILKTEVTDTPVIADKERARPSIATW